MFGGEVDRDLVTGGVSRVDGDEAPVARVFLQILPSELRRASVCHPHRGVGSDAAVVRP
jgi:hypothetical protein